MFSANSVQKEGHGGKRSEQQTLDITGLTDREAPGTVGRQLSKHSLCTPRRPESPSGSPRGQRYFHVHNETMSLHAFVTVRVSQGAATRDRAVLRVTVLIVTRSISQNVSVT